MSDAQRASGAMRSQRAIQRSIDQVRVKVQAVEADVSTRATQTKVQTLEDALIARLNSLEQRIEALEQP